MALEILVPPVGEPVSVLEVRAYLRIGSEGDDAILALLIGAAREAFEVRTGRALITRQLRQTFLGPMGPGIVVPGASPVQAILTASVLDEKGVPTPATSELVRLLDGKFNISQTVFGLVVDYRAGYATAAQIPQAFKLAIIEAVGEALARRDGLTTDLKALGPALWDRNIQGVKL
ncbi:head-tail connector protein [Candidatus Phycosocius spiralis]|uniref:Uncharacterized protein n=1 Tax=Candidatus Phycosocius spiralis TaxID=2815099 RepID=A0ABQ4PX65_9PROT|nr:phage head-tail connector protein [Candidatus Phycosocius spiralis]GIU67618.1 hypothetical protein PsB1_1772 [Candidatus Phycosocius spiralis]